MVQNALYTKLQKTNSTVRNLGVKQAPFMVLVGATMPSILAEISFITNRQEATLLKTDKYKQQIAEALFAGVLRYQQALKKVPAIAGQLTTGPADAFTQRFGWPMKPDTTITTRGRRIPASRCAPSRARLP